MLPRSETSILSAEPQPTTPVRKRLFRRLFIVAGEWRDADTVTVAEVVNKLGDRSFGWLLLFFAILSMLPIPAGGLITSIPLFWVLGQMALGYPQIRLPAYISVRKVNRRAWQRLVLRMGPVIRPVERMLQPRLDHLFSPRNERLVGAFQCITTFALFLPLPLSGFIPATSLVITGLGMVERDGRVLLIGLGVGVISILVTVFMAALMVLGVEAIV